MAQFIPFEPNIEVNGQTVLSVVNGINEVFKPKMDEILIKHGIISPKEGDWFSQAKWLDAFKEIAETIGKHTLFSIGKSIPENADFPPEINNLEKALSAIDIAYHMNHRIKNAEILFNPETGEMNEGIGHYKLVNFNAKNREAVMECNNPYPCHFDKGIITTMVRRFAPNDSLDQTIMLNSEKSSRLTGGDTSWYNITW